MKRTTLTALAGTLLGSLMLAGATAQAQTPNPAKPPLQTNAPVARTSPVDRMLDSWTLRLGLTDEQKPKVKAILEEEAQKQAELRKHTELKLEERRTNYTAIREQTRAKFKEVLTPEQWQKYSAPFQPRTNRPPVRPITPPPATPAK